MEHRLANYIRTHRRKAGLSHRELARVLGYKDDATVARHERFSTLPPLLIVLAYEVIFRIPASKLFAGLHEGVEANIEERLADLERDLQGESGNSRKASAIMQKLSWLRNRRG